MTQFLTFLFALTCCFSGISQNLNSYSYVVVPNRFEIQSQSNQYKLNEMAQFYFDKNGFNAFMSSEKLNAPQCDGLYADVEEINLFIGTGLEIVLRDCNNEEVFRSQVGRSKYKEFEKAYQDALRKAFRNFETLKVKQPDIAHHSEFPNAEDVPLNTNRESDMKITIESKITDTTSNVSMGLPTTTYTTYTSEGSTYLLQKTGEGYSLYQEKDTAGEQLVLIGKIIVMDAIIKYMDVEGTVSDVDFDTDGSFTIGLDVYIKTAN